MLKPFKFENFKTAEELQVFLEERYLKIRKDINVLIRDIEKAGVGNYSNYTKQIDSCKTLL